MRDQDGHDDVREEGDGGLPDLVLDTSAFMGGLQISGQGRLYTTPLVERELEGVEGSDLLRASGLEVVEPPREAVERVWRAARGTGDDARLSDADVEVLALALDMGATILTDDYSIQNLASGLGVAFRGVAKRGIERELEWTYRCRGCGRYFDEDPGECPICGSGIRSARPRKGH